MASYYLASEDVHQKTNWTCWGAALESVGHMSFPSLHTTRSRRARYVLVSHR